MGWTPDKSIDNYVAEADYTAAYSVLVTQATLGAPENLALSASTLLGRGAAGGIAALTPAEIVALLGSSLSLDAAYNGGSTVTADAADVIWNLTGAYSFTVDTSAATGTADGFQVLEGTDYFWLNHTGANSLGLTAVIASGSINASKGFAIDTADASRFQTTGANLTLSTVTSGTLAVTSAGILDLDGTTITANAISIDASSNVTGMGTLGCGAITSSGTLALAANSITMTGSLATTGARVTKGWFTDLEVTNAIAGSITGNAATVTVADTTDTTCYVGLFEDATGSLAAKTDAALTYNASTGTLAATSMGVASGGVYYCNSVLAMKNPTTGTWLIAGSGNASMTGTYNTCGGDLAGHSISSGSLNTLFGVSSGLDAATVGNMAGFGGNALRSLTSGADTSAFGTGAGRYYGSGTDPLLAATQGLFLGASSRASASGNTNEIVIGYNAIGAGSNTATLGNTSITSTILRGAVSGPTSYDATKAGTAKAITDLLTLTNTGNAVDMDGTGVGMLWNLYYYDVATPAVWDAGRIVVAAEQDATSTASTQDSYMAFYTSLDGTNAERVRIASDGKVGIGTTPAAFLHSYGTTEQLRLGYDAAKYCTFTVNSSGNMTMQPSGTAVNVSGAFGVTGAASSAGYSSTAMISATLTTEQLRLKYDSSNYASFTVDASGDMNIAPVGASAANLGFWTSTFGTSANKVIGLASGTAPTTSPADAVQMWSADFNAAAGKAALHLRDESGVLSVFGNNWGLFTAGAEVIDATANKTIFLSNGTAPSAHTDDGIYIYSADCAGSYNSGLASAAFFSEEPVAAIGSYVPDRVWPITINGMTYLMFLQACNLS